MSVLELPVSSDLNSFDFQIDLEGAVYTLRFHFNTKTGQVLTGEAHSHDTVFHNLETNL